ncbi:S26 family signal peptidase [Streptomyces sp. NPDC056454]|uniref:S26 family signal peptidase n=1 Tax=Streptomyces sp. NPDC056454 TaxID=3345823 RepID=UPI003678CE83
MTSLEWTLAGAFSAAAALGLATYKLARGRLVVVTIQGLSMLPTYKPGDRVLVRRGGRPGRGQIIVVERPERSNDFRGGQAAEFEILLSGAASPKWLIKRVAGVPGDHVPEGGIVPPGKLILLGDNPAVSLDSRQLGFFSSERVLGTVWRRF